MSPDPTRRRTLLGLAGLAGGGALVGPGPATSATERPPSRLPKDLLAGRRGSILLADDRGCVLQALGLDEARNRRLLPGSLLKPFLLVAALDARIPWPMVLCNRDLRAGGRSLPCAHPRFSRALDAEEALAWSCNSAFAALGDALPNAVFVNALVGRGLASAGVKPRDRDHRQLLGLGLAPETAISLEGALTAYAWLLRRRGEPRLERLFNGLAAAMEEGLAASPGTPNEVESVRLAGKTGTAGLGDGGATAGWFVGDTPGQSPRRILAVRLEAARGVDAAIVARNTAMRTSILGRREAFGGESPRASPAGETVLVGGSGLRPRRLAREDYVAAVVEAEASSFRSDAARMALAVVARTWLHRFRDRHRSDGYDVCDTSHCQSLRDFDDDTGEFGPTARAAADATRGERLWIGGRPVPALHHAQCGGDRLDVRALWPELDSPALRALHDPWCVRRSSAWRAEFDLGDISRALKAEGLQTPAVIARIDARSTLGAMGSPGRVRELVLRGERGETVALAASTLRFAIGRRGGWNRIRSDWFTVSASRGRATFVGRGSGHGAGFCQIGADEMGLAGRSYEEILAFYFPNATLSLAARGIPWRKTTSERLDVWSVDASDARRVMGLARSALAGVEGRVGRRAGRIVLWVYPDIDTWRDASGASGRIAAFTRGGRIDLQPVAVLDRRAALELTVRHEIAHAVIESVARQGTPALLREGLAIHLSGGAIGDGEEAAFHRRAQQEIRARIAARGERAVIEELWRPFRQPSL